MDTKVEERQLRIWNSLGSRIARSPQRPLPSRCSHHSIYGWHRWSEI